MKPVWQVPSKEVRKIFQWYYRRLEFRLKTEVPDGKSPMARGDPTWPPESYQRKRTYVTELGTKKRESIRRIKLG